MLYDNEILSTLNAVAKPLTLKQALSKWGNDPLWHKLVSDGYIQYYPHAVTVTSIAKKWLKERELHHWVLEQRLKETENKEECWEICKYAILSHFSDVEAGAYTKATAGDYEEMLRELSEMHAYERMEYNDAMGLMFALPVEDSEIAEFYE